MLIDSKFLPEAADFDLFQSKSIETMTDDALLEDLNQLPRQIGVLFHLYDKVKHEIGLRELLITKDVPIEERNDDWLAEQRNKIKLELAELKKQDDELREFRDQIDQEFMRRFEERGTSGTRTSKFTISVREDDSYPEIQDRTEFEDYILRTKNIHLLQKRLSLSAIQEELAAKKEEYASYKEQLDNAIDKEGMAETIYKELFQCPDNKLEVLKMTKQIVPTLEQELKDFFSIPGIGIVTKKTINAVKRG